MDTKPSTVVIWDERAAPIKSRDTSTRSHVTNQKRYIFIFTGPMDLKISRLVTLDQGTPPTKSRDISTAWSRDKSKTLYLHFRQAYGPHT